MPGKFRFFSISFLKPPRGSSIEKMAEFYTQQHEMDQAMAKGIEGETIFPKGAVGFCNQCSKQYEWRKQLNEQGFTSEMFCSIECMAKSMARWSRFCWWVHDEIGCRFIWKPYYHVQEWWYAKNCPTCHEKMMVLLPYLQNCDNDSCSNFGETVEIFRVSRSKFAGRWT